MYRNIDVVTVRSRHTPLAACVASLFALSMPVASLAANSWSVTSCLDDGTAGTLRSVINAPTTLSGDTVDLSTLACPSSKISLATGGQHISVAQNSLTIQGPAASVFTIDGSALDTYYKNYSNIFYHVGTGTLTISDLKLTGGHQSHKTIDSLGGCIYSAGSIQLSSVLVSTCTAYSQQASAKGGAVYAKGNVGLSHSTISGSFAAGSSSASAGGVYARGGLSMWYSSLVNNTASSATLVIGGGARVNGNLTAKYSNVSGNKVAGTSVAAGGGLYLYSNVRIDSSTIAGNSSSGNFGGIDAFSAVAASKTFQIGNSTISGNTAAGVNGGLYVNSGVAKFYNSTIAYNTAATTNPSSGVELSAVFAPMVVTLQSTLMAGNTDGAGTSEDDLSALANGANTVTFNGAPANNLIRATAATGLPVDTIYIVCPLLGPLRANGGFTRTHALLSHSPAIDIGNSSGKTLYPAAPYPYDQRGLLPYARVSNNVADIGAYEVDQQDVIYNTSFEGCLSVI